VSSETVRQQIQKSNQHWFEQFSQPTTMGNFTFWTSTYKSHLANGATCLKPSSTEIISKKDIEPIMNHALKHFLPFSWTVNPCTIPLSYQYQSNDYQEVVACLSSLSFQKINVVIHYLNAIPSAANRSDIAVKPLTDDDVSPWLAAFTKIFKQNDGGFTKKYETIIKRDLKKDNPNNIYYAGYFNNELIATGVLSIKSTYGVITAFGVHPEFFVKGLETPMITDLLKNAKKLNLSYVLFQLLDDQKLYESMGFQTITNLCLYTFTPDKITNELIELEKTINSSIYNKFMPNKTIFEYYLHCILNKK
jgi:N-acetylglutamate synthase-like GNAT family acetyltransferase